MFTIRKAEERGLTKLDWLESYHSFSFGNYFDPKHTGFGPLLVINDDTIMANSGFGTHSHDNMEIITYVLEGSITHKDSMNHVKTIKSGEVQVMSAGTGISHSEYNASLEEKARFIQIWIRPQELSTPPSYNQKHFSDADKLGELLPLASDEIKNGSLFINQQVDLYVTMLNAGMSIKHNIQDHKVWIQMAKGQASVNGHDLKQGDGASITDEDELAIDKADEAEILIFVFR